ncbi:peptidoglycan-binding protein [Streptomyces sp. Wb2n-11]|uniref:peptidoglycan-binding domain-containing protein n=1 Tax=Streptomyces sp. Wb2n-11 TaxID=1030533 RepID=UPI000A520C75|nr:peptidoglycan-binding domain-containing protein [Streptomyces sp. Wb2n-11]
MLVRHRVALASAAVLGGLALSVSPTVAHSAAPAAAPVPVARFAPPAYCGHYDGSTTTRRGHSGAAVREAQCLINHRAGGEALAVDGVFGARTESWVVRFQDVKGLQVDGIVGPRTWAALRAL